MDCIDDDLELGRINEDIIMNLLQDMYADTEFRVEFHPNRFSAFDYKVLDHNNRIVHQINRLPHINF